ncbi:MAG TPA: ArgR family transcriptional regulator [Candidatus Xenobia bacterium]|nr:ArgR family transcriptional regulator [Candidatus Xenobia bacterium]
MSKPVRHQQILDIIARQPVLNQEVLRRELSRRGLRVTQATLSRDLKELGLLKTPHGYALPSAVGASGPPLPPLPHLLKEFVTEIREAQNLLVLKTNIGSAQPVAAALDTEQWQGIVGTVAGDDTILVISPSRKAAQGVAQRIREMIA